MYCCCLTPAEPPAESIANAAEMPIASFFSGTELLDSTGTPVLQKLVKSQLIAVSVTGWIALLLGNIRKCTVLAVCCMHMSVCVC